MGRWGRSRGEAVEWYSLPLSIRIQISRSVKQGEAAPLEHRGIALREAKRRLTEVRAEGAALAILVPSIAAGLIGFTWSDPALRETILILIVAMLGWWGLITIPSMMRSKKRLMRAIELNSDQPTDPTPDELPPDAAE